MGESRQTELVVIGAGPGGYAAAFRAADLGKQVLLIDRDPELGGVCLNRGCIPSKALLHISKVMDQAKHLEIMGVKYGNPEINIDKVNKISGMDITFVTSAPTDKEAKSLLTELGLPFKKN